MMIKSLINDFPKQKKNGRPSKLSWKSPNIVQFKHMAENWAKKKKLDTSPTSIPAQKACKVKEEVQIEVEASKKSWTLHHSRENHQMNMCQKLYSLYYSEVNTNLKFI